MKALVGAFNQEKALVGAFSVIVQPVVEPMDRLTALLRIPEAGRDRDRDGGHQLRRDSWRLSSSDLSEADSWADKRRVTH